MLALRRSLLVPGVRNVRFKSSYSLDGFGGSGSASVTRWPVTRPNTIFNIVPQGYKYVVERFGKLHSIEDSGWFLAIPFVDTISYVVDVRELAIDIPPQSAITRDNVAVEVSGNLFIQFVDPQKAAYGALNPLYSVTQVCKVAGVIEFFMCFHALLTDLFVFWLLKARSVCHALCHWRDGT